MTVAARLGWIGAALCLLVAPLRVPFQHPAGGYFHVALPQELLTLAGALLLTTVAASGRQAICVDAVSRLIAGLLVIELASSIGAQNGLVGLRASSLWGTGLLIFLVARAASSPASRRASELAVTAVLGVISGSILLEALAGVRLSALHHAPGGLLAERNLASEFLLCGAPVALLMASNDDSRWRRVVGVCVVGAIGSAVAFCRTRSAWLAGCLLVSWSLFLLITQRGALPRKRALLTLGVAVASIAFSLMLPTRLAWTSSTPYRDSATSLLSPASPSAAGRLVQYSATLRMIAADPLLGAGPGNWSSRYLEFASPDDPGVVVGPWVVNRLPNSDWLGFAAERGLIGLALLACLAVAVAKRSDTCGRLVLGVLAVIGCFDSVIQTPAALTVVAWTLGSRCASRPSGPEVSWLGFAAAACVLLPLTLLAAQRLQGLWLAATSRDATQLSRGALLDRDDVGLQLYAAQALIAHQQCDAASPHLALAQSRAARSPFLGLLLEQCSGGRRLRP